MYHCTINLLLKTYSYEFCNNCIILSGIFYHPVGSTTFLSECLNVSQTELKMMIQAVFMIPKTSMVKEESVINLTIQTITCK